MLDAILGYLDRLAQGPDLDLWAGRTRDVLEAGNADRAEAGVDASGAPLLPLRGGLALAGSELDARGGDGPPLAPRGRESRVVTGYVLEVIPNGRGGATVRGSWPGLPWLRYHPERMRAGISESDRAGLADVAADVAAAYLRP